MTNGHSVGQFFFEIFSSEMFRNFFVGIFFVRPAAPGVNNAASTDESRLESITRPRGLISRPKGELVAAQARPLIDSFRVITLYYVVRRRTTLYDVVRRCTPLAFFSPLGGTCQG